MNRIFFLAALIALATSCAHTDIKRGPDDCGTFASSDHGLGIVVPTAGQYATYAQACGTERFSRIIAEQRMAVVAGARAVVGGGHDAVARAGIAQTKRDLTELTDIVVGDLESRTGEGGAR